MSVLNGSLNHPLLSPMYRFGKMNAPDAFRHVLKFLECSESDEARIYESDLRKFYESTVTEAILSDVKHVVRQNYVNAKEYIDTFAADYLITGLRTILRNNTSENSWHSAIERVMKWLLACCGSQDDIKTLVVFYSSDIEWMRTLPDTVSCTVTPEIISVRTKIWLRSLSPVLPDHMADLPISNSMARTATAISSQKNSHLSFPPSRIHFRNGDSIVFLREGDVIAFSEDKTSDRRTVRKPGKSGEMVDDFIEVLMGSSSPAAAPARKLPEKADITGNMARLMFRSIMSARCLTSWTISGVQPVMKDTGMLPALTVSEAAPCIRPEKVF